MLQQILNMCFVNSGKDYMTHTVQRFTQF